MVLKEGSRCQILKNRKASAEHPWCPGTVLKNSLPFSLTDTLRRRAVYSLETQVYRAEAT